MWVILPVKRLDDSKLRLAGVLAPAQRRHLSLCMLEDILDTLAASVAVGGVTVVSCDTDVMELARGKAADVPELGGSDLAHLDRVHGEGVTLCPAANDGGTNGLVFTPPLAMEPKYG